MRYRARLARLEARRLPRTHHLPVVRIPGAIDGADWEVYLATLPCPCGALFCEARTIWAGAPGNVDGGGVGRDISPPEGGMTHHARIRRLELQHLVDLAARMGAPYGLSAAVVLHEMRRVLSLPDAEQRAYFADFYARLTAAEARELDAIRVRHGRILRCGIPGGGTIHATRGGGL